MQMTKEQRIFIVLENETTKNCEQVRRAFNETFPERNSPDKKTVYRTVRKFNEHGSISNRYKGNSEKKIIQSTENNIAIVQPAITENPTISVRRNYYYSSFLVRRWQPPWLSGLRPVLDLVYLDFQKAFDKVPHERLMAKVEANGIRGNYSRWIQNWLTGRTQRVVIHDETSDPALVTSGVPEGSVLGPLLFIIYINNLDVGIISKINKFDDDTKLCHSAFTERDRATIQSDLNRLLQWSETWQMSFNIENWSVMHVGANNRHFQHTMYNIPIETVQQQRDLGVIVTENLKHDKQVEKSVKNASRILGFTARNFEYKSKNIILPLYKALVQPHLEYAVQLWSPTLRKDINKMEKIRRKATKMIPELCNLSYERRLQRLELISLEQRKLRGQLIETFKYLNGLNNVTLEGLFEKDGNVRTKSNSKKLLLRNFKTSQAMNFFPVKIASTWNQLP
ncbi:Protein of unknown function DUF4817 [Trinorchestia longiramus]|nr:Protein of unknown function DUF4817 [Trinorchestia longiramus]